MPRGRRREELHLPADPFYLGLMEPRTRGRRAPWFSASWLLEFRPWMLALAVFLACALGIAVMEQFDGRVMWAQAEPRHAPQGR
jgi:hypothetical protein